MKRLIIALLLFSVIVPTASGRAETGEIETTAADQTRLSVTIYNQDMALVKDLRRIALPAGEPVLAVKDVSGQIIPETALVKSEGLSVIEQNFEFDLLTPESLLKKFTGKEVTVVKTHPETGEETRLPATVLSTTQGVVLEMGNTIESGIPGRITFPYVPENLRQSPTLTLTVNTVEPGTRDLELTYLTHGLTWKADYVAQLDQNDETLDLSGWVTLTNTSQTDYDTAELQLVAGDINLAPAPDRRIRYKVAPVPMAAESAGFSQEAMFEYHLYTLGRRTTLKNNQTKQVALLQATGVPCTKEYRVRGASHRYLQPVGDIADTPKVSVYLEFQNTKADHLGIPIPKGTVRVYKEDSNGRLQFAGEDTTDHTPENKPVRLKLGNAFDVTCETRQTDFKKLTRSSGTGYDYETSHELVITNSKAAPVTVKVMEQIPGQWRIINETRPHDKASSAHAVWNIPVPAKGTAALGFTVQTR